VQEGFGTTPAEAFAQATPHDVIYQWTVTVTNGAEGQTWPQGHAQFSVMRGQTACYPAANTWQASTLQTQGLHHGPQQKHLDSMRISQPLHCITFLAQQRFYRPSDDCVGYPVRPVQQLGAWSFAGLEAMMAVQVSRHVVGPREVRIPLRIRIR
jgi:hypothetical protein